jgi:hypothetical protein
LGLDTTHGAYSGSYGGFRAWREKVAETAGFDLNSMIGFGGEAAWKIDEGLCLILDHSDCEGEIRWWDCLKVALALTKILRKMDKESREYRQTKRFALGCLEAYKARQDLGFH